jgi:hypothetical protein
MKKHLYWTVMLSFYVLYFRVKETVLFLSSGLHYFKWLISDKGIMLTSHYRTPLTGYFVSPIVNDVRNVVKNLPLLVYALTQC